MNNFSQQLVNGLDKTTVAGMTEAVLIAIGTLKNRQGLLVNVKLDDNFGEHIEFATQIAETLLDKKRTDE